jgi:hypothetical protein
MQLKAYDSHVSCYTQPSNSICDLGHTDWLKIMKAVDPVASIQDQKSRRQILEVSRICLDSAQEESKETIKALIKKVSP